jgi:hypothetical protein
MVWERGRKPEMPTLCGESSENRLTKPSSWSRNLQKEVLVKSGKGELQGPQNWEPIQNHQPAKQRGTWSNSQLSTWLMSKLLAGSGESAPVIYLIPAELHPEISVHSSHFFTQTAGWSQDCAEQLWGKGLLGEGIFLLFFFLNWTFWWVYILACERIAMKSKVRVAL